MSIVFPLHREPWYGGGAIIDEIQCPRCDNPHTHFVGFRAILGYDGNSGIELLIECEHCSWDYDDTEGTHLVVLIIHTHEGQTTLQARMMPATHRDQFTLVQASEEQGR